MKKAENSAGFVQIILILVVIAMVGGAYYFGTLKPKQNVVIETPTEKPITSAVKPTSDPTVNWKTINSKLWTFKVPSTLNYFECSSHDQIYVGEPNSQSGMFTKDQIIECNFDQPGDIFHIFRGLHNSENNIIIPINTDPKVDPVVSEVQSITVDGKRATLQKETTQFGQGMGSRYKVYVDNTAYTDVITFNDISQKTLFDQILSTFKFTK